MKKTIKLDISFGDLPEDWKYERVKDFDPLVYPWTLGDESVEEAYSGFLLNRIEGPDRIKFMDELWRVLIPQGKATIIVPYWSHPKTTIDPGFKYPGFSEMSFFMYNKQWRETQKLNSCKCDFDFSYGYNLEDETKNRNAETQSFWIKHYSCSVVDLHIFLTKRDA